MDELAGKVGVSKSLISQWEANKIKSLKADNIFRLSDVLDCNTRWLLYAKDPRGLDLPMGKPRHLTPDASQLVDIFEQLNPTAQEELISDAEKYLRLTSTSKQATKANPYPKGLPKRKSTQ
jgi:transcriptional regulator with XRE-family HTH domain